MKQERGPPTHNVAWHIASAAILAAEMGNDLLERGEGGINLEEMGRIVTNA